MKPFFCVLLFFFGAVFSLSAQTFGMDYPQVTTLHSLYAKYGKSFPLTSFPVSDRRILSVCNDLMNFVQGEDIGTVRQIRKLIEDRPAEPKVFALAMTAVSADTKWINPGSETRLEKLKTYLNEDPFLYGGLGVTYPNTAFLYMDIEARRVFTEDKVYSNIPIQPVSTGWWAWRTEFHDVRRGILALTGEYLDLYIGRDKVQYGPNESSLIADPDLPWLDAIRLEAYFGNFTLSSRVSTLFNGRVTDDVTVQAPYAFDQNVILDSFHRFQYKGGNFRIAVSDNCYFVRPMNNFQLGDIFPVFSYHNADFVPNNNALIVDATVLPVNGLEISAQIGLDDVNANTFGIPDDSTPTIDSEILGIFLPGFHSLKVEIGQTHYLWGNFDDKDAMARAIYRLQLNGGDHWIPMTSPYGPGTLWSKFSMGWNLSSEVRLGVKGELVGHKSGASLITTPYRNDASLAWASYDDWWGKVSVPVEFNLAWGELQVNPGLRISPNAPMVFLSLKYHWAFIFYQSYEKGEVRTLM